MLDTDGNVVVEYKYSAWGNTIVTNVSDDAISDDLGHMNPFRYRGYYYSDELGLYYLKSRFYDPEVGRFISADIVDYLAPDTINGLNLYAYCKNNPVMFCDPTGHFWDYVFDAIFIAWGIYDLVTGGYKDWENWVALGVDLLFAVVPFIPSGGGQVIKVGNRIDNAIDVANAINKIDSIQDISKVTVIGRSMDRVRETATLIGKADNLYNMWKGFDNLKAFSMLLGYGASGMENGLWMLNKMRNGYTIIDIGITTTHKGVGFYYGIEHFIIAQWKTRHFWKIPINIA